MTEDQELLARYAREGTEEAFAGLVERHLGLVYAAALRQLRDPAAAQDAAQMVFTNLARKAKSLPGDTVLAGWLHCETRYRCLNFLRTEQRRRQREQAAALMNMNSEGSPDEWEQLLPVLDEALNQLNATNRDALLLRFFQQRSLREVGEQLGLGEEAARKRVARALDQLAAILARKGITGSAAALSAWLAANSLSAAPAGLVSVVTPVALAGATSATGGLAGLFKLNLMAMSKLKTAAAITAIASAIATHFALQSSATGGLRRENQALRVEATAVGQLRQENERLAGELAQAKATAALSADQLSELMRLRNEVGRLRKENLELAKARRGSKESGSPARTEPLPMIYPDSTRREAYRNAGYDTPRAGLETLLWAITHEDAKAMQASFSPQMKETMASSFKDMPEGVMPGGFKNGTMYRADGFHVISEKSLSDEEVVFELFLEGRNQTMSIKLRKVEGDWKWDGNPID